MKMKTTFALMGILVGSVYAKDNVAYMNNNTAAGSSIYESNNPTRPASIAPVWEIIDSSNNFVARSDQYPYRITRQLQN
jgi:hypothetical protein